MKKRLTIGIDISQIVYQTGVSRYTVQLVKNLLKVDPENRYVFYAGSLRLRSVIRSFYAEIKQRRTRLVLTPFSPLLADWWWNRLRLFPIETLTGPLDVFHSSDWTQPKARAAKVTTIHDLTAIKFPKTHHPRVVRVHRRRLQLVKKECQLVITDSQATKKDLINLGFDPQKIRVVYLAASDDFKPVKDKSKIAAVLRRYGIKRNFVFNVGTLQPRKNLPRLIKAFKLLQRQHPHLQLVISGQFGWGEKVKPVENVVLTGFVPDQDLAVLYSAASCFVYPSLYEGFGLPVLEALSCGCPVITSNLSSLPEVAGDAALLVDPRRPAKIAEAIHRLLSQPTLRKKLSEKALSQAKRFSWEKTARQTLQVYQEALHTPGV